VSSSDQMIMGARCGRAGNRPRSFTW